MTVTWLMNVMTHISWLILICVFDGYQKFGSTVSVCFYISGEINVSFDVFMQSRQRQYTEASIIQRQLNLMALLYILL